MCLRAGVEATMMKCPVRGSLKRKSGVKSGKVGKFKERTEDLRLVAQSQTFPKQLS